MSLVRNIIGAVLFLLLQLVGETFSWLCPNIILVNQLLVHKNNMGREPRDGVTNSNDLCFSTNQELFTKTKRCVILKMPQPLCLHLLLVLKEKKKSSS